MVHIKSSLSWSLFRVGSLSIESEGTSDEIDAHGGDRWSSERSCQDVDIAIFVDRKQGAWQNAYKDIIRAMFLFT